MWATIGKLYLTNKRLDFFNWLEEKSSQGMVVSAERSMGDCSCFSYLNQQLKMLFYLIVYIRRYPTKLTNLTAS